MDKSDDAKMTDPDPAGRSFALLDQGQRERLGAILRPLAWIDGLITAAVIAPGDADVPDDADLDDPSVLEDAMVWIEHIWAEETAADPDNLTPAQTAEAALLATDHYCHVANLLLEDPEAYRPYLEGFSDPREAASQWAAGFCGGIGLTHQAWEPLLQDEDAGPLLVAIFSLLREEDMPEESRRDSPLRDLPADRLVQMRRSVVDMLPEIVLDLYDHARALDGDLDLDDDDLGLDDDLDLDEDDDLRRNATDWKPTETYTRAGPKVGRNDPCPCGSGKKYKKCCIDQA